jgi:hypothetical protein
LEEVLAAVVLAALAAVVLEQLQVAKGIMAVLTLNMVLAVAAELGR